MPDPLPFSPCPEGTRIRLRVRPGARRTAIVGLHGGALKVSVCAAPERGRANEAVAELLAARLGIAPSAVRLIAGHGAPDKVVVVPVPPEVARRRLLGGDSAHFTE